MRVLLVDAYGPDDGDRQVSTHTQGWLGSRGHEIDRLRLHDFAAFMTAQERSAYHSEQPVVSDDVRDSVARVRLAEAMLFCYPSVAFTVPAVLKGWLERVLVPGVGFVFDDQHRIQPGMQNIRRIGAVTTSPHSRLARLRARDAGKRTTARTLRLSCHRRCRITFLTLRSPVGPGTAERIHRAFRRW